jgi:hypothetical protein
LIMPPADAARRKTALARRSSFRNDNDIIALSPADSPRAAGVRTPLERQTRIERIADLLARGAAR